MCAPRACSTVPEPVVTAVSDLAAALRARGVHAGVGEVLSAHRALATVDPADPADAYFALRAALCSRRADLDAFDAAWADLLARAAAMPPRPPEALDDAARLVLPRVAVPGGERPDVLVEDVEAVPAAWSPVELLRDVDFADYTDAERAVARRLMVRLAARGPRRTSRRTQPVRRRGDRPDLRRTMRASLRSFGEPTERRWRARTTAPRPLVIVCDVSGSMEPYARMLLQYAQACVATRARVEAFTFGTRLTRVTRELRGHDHDAALARAAAAVEDWSGGTRIGAALAELNRVHGRRVGRGAVVVVASDGWDRGDPAQLAAEMAHLRRCAHAVVWVNPLKAQAGYEPLTRGMVAALPHVDHFLAGSTLRSLEDLAQLMEKGMT